MGFYVYLLVAFLVGILVGWFIWGRLRGEIDGLRGEMDRTRSDRDKFRTDATRLTGELDACASARADLERRLREAQAAPAPKSGTASAASQAPAAMISSSTSSAKPAASAKPASAAKPAAAKKPAASKAASASTISAKPKAAPKASAAPKAAAAKPAASKTTAPKSTASKTGASKAATAKTAAPKAAASPKKAATAGKTATAKGPDNLRRLIGIGPVNERKLNELGVRTFADIAGWKAADIKRVEDALAFDGRVEREKWIEQAKLLAAGNEKEFARRFPTAGTASNS